KAKLELWLAGRSEVALERVGRLADGWLASLVSVEEVRRAIATIRAAAARAGRAIDDDHYGVVFFYARSAGDVSPEARRLLDERPAAPAAEAIAVGAAAARELVERFVDAGASKFVAVPLASPAHLEDVLLEFRDEVVTPVETKGALLND